MKNDAAVLEAQAIPELMGKNFFIPDYQRGYRWGSKQILQLIEDLYRFFSSNDNASFYCLQPIVVQKCSEEVVEKYKLKSDLDNNIWYEVIDGQQRLTTLRVLLAFYYATSLMDNRKAYRLAYATRPNLGLALDSLKIDLMNRQYTYDADGLDRNVDFRYIEGCIKTVFKCFDHDKPWSSGEDFHLQLNDLSIFFKNLLNNEDEKKSVKVLWYETKENKDARAVFERINDLKIPLSNSELIRGLFLSEVAEYPFDMPEENFPKHVYEEMAIQDKLSKQRYINSRWDEIEHRLRDDSFWAFITNRSPADTRNRIEILFDLMSQRYVGGKTESCVLNKNDPQYTYLYFDLLIRERKINLWELWKQVQACYSRLNFWYENNDYYHRIGYLIYLQKNGDQILTELLSVASTRKKDEFKAELIRKIKATLPDADAVKNLDYQDKMKYEQIRKLLILHNIETCRLCETAGRFPFALFKKTGEEKGWTLEHIHAQNSECLDKNDKSEWLKWAEVNAKVLDDNRLYEDKDPDLLHDINDAINHMADPSFTHDKIVSLFDRVAEVYKVGEIPVLHQLSNLALLDGGVNAGIGNSVFEVKRQYISKCNADGEYIPICTRKVFLKYYYDKGCQDVELLNKQTFSWDADDRRNYIADIMTVLADFLPAEAFKVSEV